MHPVFRLPSGFDAIVLDGCPDEDPVLHDPKTALLPTHSLAFVFTQELPQAHRLSLRPTLHLDCARLGFTANATRTMKSTDGLLLQIANVPMTIRLTFLVMARLPSASLTEGT